MKIHRAKRTLLSVVALLSVWACDTGGNKTHASGSSATAAPPRDSALMQQNAVLQAQKDPLFLAARGLFEAISAIDSATAVAGVKAPKKGQTEPLEAYEVQVRKRTVAALQRLRSVQSRLK